MPWERVRRLIGEGGHFLSVAITRDGGAIEILDRNGAGLISLSAAEAEMLAASLQLKVGYLKQGRGGA